MASTRANFAASEDAPHPAATPDRRRRRRLPLALIARIEPVSAARSSAPVARPAAPRRGVIGHLRDISNRGAYLWSGQPFTRGQTLHLALEVPRDQGRNWTLEIECDAEVVRVEPGYPQLRETGVAVRILRFSIPKVMSAAEAFFPFGDATDSPAH